MKEEAGRAASTRKSARPIPARQWARTQQPTIDARQADAEPNPELARKTDAPATKDVAAPGRLWAILVSQFGPVKIHSYLSPVDGLQVNTQMIEGPNAIVIFAAQLLLPYADEVASHVQTLGKPVDRIILSHAHTDHWAGLQVLTERFPDARVFALDGIDRAATKVAVPTETITEGLQRIDGAAFSQEEAQRREVEWLDLVRSEGTNKRLATLVAAFARDGYRPEYLQSLVSVDDARKRWGALAAFYKDHGHFLVTNGPYKLKGWSPDKVMFEAFRDLSYPLGVGSYDNYAVPRRGYVTKVEQADKAITLSGDIELLSKHMRSYDIVRTPLQSVPGDALTRSAPECRYMVTDNEGRVVLAGQVPLAEDKGFHIDLGGKLPPGQFTLLAEIIVNGNAVNVDIKRIPIVIPSDP